MLHVLRDNCTQTREHIIVKLGESASHGARALHLLGFNTFFLCDPPPTCVSRENRCGMRTPHATHSVSFSFSFFSLTIKTIGDAAVADELDGLWNELLALASPVSMLHIVATGRRLFRTKER